MAEGGDLIDFITPDDDDNISDDNEQEVNRTGPFEPYAASTPYHGGEQYELQTMMHEQSGLPDTSYEETPLLGGAQGESQRSWNALTRLFPNASATNLETSYHKDRLYVKMAGTGKKSYPLITKNKYTGKDQLNPGLTKEIKESLGQFAEPIDEDRDTIKEQRQRLAEAEIQLRQAEELASEREKHAQEMKNVVQQIEGIQAQIYTLQAEHGSNLESETELNRLKQMGKNYKSDLEGKKKELAALEKQ